MTTAGGCFCGAVRYRVEGPATSQTNCHCSICRRVSGASPVAWATFPLAAVAFEKGEPRIFRSTPGGRRWFCGDCGTPLAFQLDRLADEIDIATATLDDPSAFPPKDHIFVGKGLPWNEPLDGLPVYRGSRSEGL